MNRSPTIASLARKSTRALRSASLNLQAGDPDSAVNRAYYAMFNVARAGLLNAGVAEAELPRTHRGMVEAFRVHAVQTGRIDAELASTLSRTESLRMMADYTSKEIDAEAAKQVIRSAESFVSAVGREFELDLEVDRAPLVSGSHPSLDEVQRKAVERWRLHRFGANAVDPAKQPDDPAKSKSEGLDLDDGLDSGPDP